MEYAKVLMLSMSLLITVLSLSSVAARHHGRRLYRRQSDEMFGQEGPHQGRGHGHGHWQGSEQGPPRGMQGNVNMGSTLPGFPMKGPPSAPFVYPQQQQPRGPPPQTVIFPGSPNQQNPRNVGHQNPLATNNYPTNNLPIYVNNPFLPKQNTQGQQVNTANRNNVSPKQYEDIQNLPSIEPVTNELPASGKPPAGSTVKPTINPRQLDLLYGSNLYDEDKTKQPQPQPNQQPDPEFNLDDRILIDTAVRCQEGYKRVGTVCRLQV